MPKRYILTGAPGSGKTSVAAGLRLRGVAVVDEAVTDLIATAQAGGVDEPWLDPTFLDDIVEEQRRRQLAAVADKMTVQVFDRSPLCTVALAAYLHLPVTPLLAREVGRVVRDRVYEPTVFLIRPLGFIEPTAARRISYPDALDFQTVHEAVYRAHGVPRPRHRPRTRRSAGHRGRGSPGRRPGPSLTAAASAGHPLSPVTVVATCDREGVGNDAGDGALATWGSGTQPSGARRRGDAVVREVSPWTATVRALLRHYETVGFTGAPRVVDSGVTADGLDAVTWVEGTSAHPHAWPDDVLPALGQLLRRAHDAGTTFTPPPDARWQPCLARTLPGSRPVLGHGDLGPWNVLTHPSGAHALIDWEFAGPVDAVWELTQAAWLNAQLHDDDIAETQGLPPPATRARQVRLLLDGYGLPAADRVGFVDRLIEYAVRAARAEAVEYRVTPDSPAVTDTGFPVLWAVTWRARSAAWILDHRAILERALQ